MKLIFFFNSSPLFFFISPAVCLILISLFYFQFHISSDFYEIQGLSQEIII